MRPVSFPPTRTGSCCLCCFVRVSYYFFLANYFVHWCFHWCFWKMKCLVVVGVVVVWGRLGCLVGGSGVW